MTSKEAREHKVCELESVDEGSVGEPSERVGASAGIAASGQAK